MSSLRATTRHLIPVNLNPIVGGIPIKYKKQRKDNWCWAACVEMVLKHNQIDDRQCQIAQKGVTLGPHPPGTSFDCCSGGTSGELCDQTLDEGPITRLWEEGYDIRVNRQTTPCPPPTDLIQTFVQLLSEKHPIELHYILGTSHVVLLYGWEGDPDSGSFNFLFHDPAPEYGSQSMPSSDVFEFNYLGRLETRWEIGKPQEWE